MGLEEPEASAQAGTQHYDNTQYNPRPYVTLAVLGLHGVAIINRLIHRLSYIERGEYRCCFGIAEAPRNVRLRSAHRLFIIIGHMNCYTFSRLLVICGIMHLRPLCTMAMNSK